MKYYDWRKTLSYDAEVTLVVTSRGRGKTYGFRDQAIRDFLDGGWRFVEICRYKAEISQVMAGYFDRLVSDGKYSDYIFKCDQRKAWIARKPSDPERKIKADEWKQIGYFVALSEQQMLKKTTFAKVKRIMFDEAILDKQDNLHRYLPNEYDILTNLLDTITRQRPGESTPCRVYLCGNAVDLLNPYFRRLGINKSPRYGYTWYNDKHLLLHYEEAQEWGDARLETTLVGHMSGAGNADVAFYNTFDTGKDEYIAKKTKTAKYRIGIKYLGRNYGVWMDYVKGYVYINDKIVNDPAKTIYTLTLEDNSVNYIMASRANPILLSIAGMYREGLVRFSDGGTMLGFLDLLRMFGIR